MKVLNGVPATLQVLQAMFPRPANVSAMTGYIPMEFFEKNEEAIRKVCSDNKLRVVWRGPRRGKFAVSTYREDAHSAVLYYK